MHPIVDNRPPSLSKPILFTMEIIDPKQKQEYELNRNPSKGSGSDSGRMVAGLVILAIGIMWLLRKLGYYLPEWLFSCPCYCNHRTIWFSPACPLKRFP